MTIDIAGRSCSLAQRHSPLTIMGTKGSWADGITSYGPGLNITNNTVINPSDVGIVFFGGKNTKIMGNIVQITQRNYGAFAGIGIHPGLVVIYRVCSSAATRLPAKGMSIAVAYMPGSILAHTCGELDMLSLVMQQLTVKNPLN